MSTDGPRSDEERGGLWTNGSFVLLFLAQVVSLVGSGTTTIGLALLAYGMAGASAATVVVGTALTLRIVAFLVFSQPAGVLADRASRKTILIVSDLVRAGLLGFLPFVSQVWHIYVLVFAINAVTALFTPTYEASVPAVVGEAHVVKALAVSRVAVDIEAVLAPAVAAAIVALVGARWVFWFDAGSYLVSAALVAFAIVPRSTEIPPPLSLRRFVDEIAYGTKVIVTEPSLRQAIVLSFGEALAGAVAIVATVAYVRDVLLRGETSVTLAMAAVGIGSSLAALVLGRLVGRVEKGVRDERALHGTRHRWTGRVLLVGGALLGLVLLPGVARPPFVGLLVLWALNGSGQALIAIASSTILASHTEPHERGRVYAAHFALTHACWLVTYPAVGYAAAYWGAPWTMTLGGVGCALVCGLAFMVRGADGDHDHPTRGRAHT